MSAFWGCINAPNKENGTVYFAPIVSMLFFAPPEAESDSPNHGKSSAQQAIFRVNVTLSIPNIAMVPALEEVQQALNRAVECVVSVSKGVGQWSKERISKVGLI